MPAQVAIVIPCYRVRGQILDVLSRIGPECQAIYVVDDCCPEQSGRWVQQQCHDPRVQVLFHESNQGVGGAVITGYRRAIAAGDTVIVKVDGDGQMDPRLVPAFVAPILRGHADYTKGNRFFRIQDVKQMPFVRLIGNAGLSFLTKLSSGYWNLFD
ncbi:MAG TPA: glycosyltransferase family 2 protein, partial [bacterium]|nr:glycosyltransferase family 2 protein [bacterium]